MRFAISTPNVGEARALVELAVAAEASGWDGFFVWDHVHLVRAMALDVHDPAVLLGAIAQATSRIRIGAMVTPVSRRRPWKLAKEWVTIDHLSGGRLIIGVGLGFPPDDEFATFGDESGARARAERLDEGLAIAEPILRGEPVRHRGAHFTVDADLHPAAVQRPRPPIWVAGMWPIQRPLARAARYDGFFPVSADGTPLSPDTIREIATRFGARGGFDIVAGRDDSYTAADYEAAGATWLVESRWPDGDWLGELSEVVRQGPRR